MRGRWQAWVWAMALVACTVPQKRAAVEKVTDDPGRRSDAFEATLRLLDEKPGYVDEFFDLARGHPKTLGRFLRDTAAKLHERPLAEETAQALARSPQGLKRVLEETVDAAADRPEARQAMLAAMRARSVKLAELLASDPATATELVRALAAVQGAELQGKLRALFPGQGARQ